MGATEPQIEALVVVPGAQVHQVENGTQRLLSSGELLISLAGEGDAQIVQAQVGSATWNLGKHLPALKAAPTIYSFGLEHTRAIYYCLILPTDTPASVLEAVQDVLASSCAFSTARQVDAAYEQADELAGGKEAQAAQKLAETATPAPGAQQQPAPGSAAATGYAGTPAAAPTPLGAVLPAATAPAAAAAVPPPSYPAPTAGAPAGPPTAATPPSASAAPGPVPTYAGSAATGTQKQGIADRVATGLLAGGAAAADIVKKGADAVTERLGSFKEKQAAKPTPSGAQAARVSPHFRSGLQLVAKVASGAAYVTSRLAAMLGDASYALALKIAKALPGHGDPPAAAEAAMHGGELAPVEKSPFKTVGAAGLMAYVQVYDALEDAAKQVVSHSAVASAQYIKYKYGEDAGKAAEESVPVAQDMVSTAMNCTRLGARALISKTAKRTAKIYLKSTLGGKHPDAQAAARTRPAAAPAIGAAPGALSAQQLPVSK